LQSPLRLKVTGGPWGLACNTVHFLDLMAWMSGESLVEVFTDQLDDSWFEAKRAGMWEISGTLTTTFSGGTTAKLTSSSTHDPTYLIELTDGNGTWSIDEINGTVVHTDGTEMPGRLAYQSEMAAPLVDEILDTGDCKLPTLYESVAIHRLFIDAMLGHWQRHSDSAATFVPIT
jgi:hypothetical protein